MAKGCLCEQMAGEGVEVSPVCLGHLWLFENLTAESLQALVRAADRKRYDRGDYVFMQGEPAHEMFLIKAGRVKLSKNTEDGAEITLDIRKAGDFLGENMLSEDVNYPLAAWCMEDTLICGFTKDGFERLVLEHPQIGLQVIRNLSERINWLATRVSSMSFTNLEDRLYSVLQQVAHEHGVRVEDGVEIRFPLTHEEISFLVGAHRVTVTRALKGLRESGRISQKGRALIVTSEV
ncbi:MAG: Crp/Fnr family transcriptional regulator [Deltaproteobacteria bacterium]|nr:Crp/Fnr family transcriptional regulator [Deltaproteobacteria bacterium]